MVRLIFAVGLGYVLGQLLWEILGILVDKAARVTGRAISLVQLMMNWQRAVVAQSKADEDAGKVVKGHVESISWPEGFGELFTFTKPSEAGRWTGELTGHDINRPPTEDSIEELNMFCDGHDVEIKAAANACLALMRDSEF